MSMTEACITTCMTQCPHGAFNVYIIPVYISVMYIVSHSPCNL